jgi:pimeloyl-ACP methyl ester carboxylesterase
MLATYFAAETGEMKKHLILLHGALGSAAQLKPLASLLSDEYQVHCLNFEGHGHESSEKSYSIDLFADNLRNYLDKNKLKKVKIFGYSMGGYVALTLAANHPSYFDRIITLGTKFEWNPEIAAKEVKLLNPDKIKEKVPRFEARLSELHGEDHWSNVMLKTAEMMKNMGEGHRTSDQVFSKVVTPTIIGWGDRDQMVSQEESEKYAHLIGAKFEILRNIPHPIDQIDPRQIKSYLINHLEGAIKP